MRTGRAPPRRDRIRLDDEPRGYRARDDETQARREGDRVAPLSRGDRDRLETGATEQGRLREAAETRADQLRREAEGVVDNPARQAELLEQANDQRRVAAQHAATEKEMRDTLKSGRTRTDSLGRETGLPGDTPSQRRQGAGSTADRTADVDQLVHDEEMRVLRERARQNQERAEAAEVGEVIDQNEIRRIQEQDQDLRNIRRHLDPYDGQLDEINRQAPFRGAELEAGDRERAAQAARAQRDQVEIVPEPYNRRSRSQVPEQREGLDQSTPAQVNPLETRVAEHRDLWEAAIDERNRLRSAAEAVEDESMREFYLRQADAAYREAQVHWLDMKRLQDEIKTGINLSPQ